ncbi:GIY-YIG nuclease family protein [Candidatus Nucleicultrix amoebiphila]|nr:GIY-YIG nuclease family protein [Candidatus Nucleicultrix amoebiphila]
MMIVLKLPAIYIVTNKRNGTLYTGVTSNLCQRIYHHKNAIISGFTQKYKCHLLVYYERFEDMETAILREKKIKSGSRHNKIKLIESLNPEWRDLYDEIF